MLGIKRSKLDCKRWKWIVLNIVTVAEGAANVLLLGFYVVRWRSDLLFSEWISK